MHELGIAQGILDLVREHVDASQAALVRSVRVRVGALSGVSGDSLGFCFEAIVAGTPMHGARLTIERVTAVCTCPDCGRDFEPEQLCFRCPGCGGTRTRTRTGAELEVVDIELDEPEEVRA